MGETLLLLAALHETTGVIHRDIKPQNLMLVEADKQMPLSLIDFGSALLAGCVCVCVREREREVGGGRGGGRESLCVCVCVCVHVYASQSFQTEVRSIRSVFPPGNPDAVFARAIGRARRLH